MGVGIETGRAPQRPVLACPRTTYGRRAPGILTTNRLRTATRAGRSALAARFAQPDAAPREPRDLGLPAEGHAGPLGARGRGAGLVPTPRTIAMCGSPSLSPIRTRPASAGPTAVGVKRTVVAHVWPGNSIRREHMSFVTRRSPTSPPVRTVTIDWKGALPVLRAVSVAVDELPTGTLPKSSGSGVRTTSPTPPTPVSAAWKLALPAARTCRVAL